MGLNGWMLPELNDVNAAMMKKTRISSLTPTITRLTVALSRVPRTSRSVIASTMITAGRLKTPPSSGASAICLGSS